MTTNSLLPLLLCAAAYAQSNEIDPAAEMVAGMTKYLQRLTAASREHRHPSADRLRYILGTTDPRIVPDGLELIGTTRQPALLAETETFRVFAVRWPVLEGVSAEGLYYQPKQPSRARIVALPDADQLPEEFSEAISFASAQCEVLIPVLINRESTWSGNPAVYMTNQTHREWIYRMGFPVGRHIIGYEVQKALAAVDWFSSLRPALPVGIYGYGEGGLIALYSAALDPRIGAAMVSGAFRERENLASEPIYRNIFGLLKDFGDAEVASLIAPRKLIVDPSPGPEVAGPPPPRSARSEAAPGALAPIEPDSVRREIERAKALRSGEWLRVADNPAALLGALNISAPVKAVELAIPVQLADERQKRQLQELVTFTQRRVRSAERERDLLWSKITAPNAEEWRKAAEPLAARFRNEVIGRLPDDPSLLNVEMRRAYEGAKWVGFDVRFDVRPEFFAYGVLLLPKDIRAGEKRAAVVVQHGLNGRPQSLFGQTDGRDLEVYRNFGQQLADLGYVVYLPQNPYRGDFRHLSRHANPLGLSLFSLIGAQYERMLDWLSGLPQVDSQRIGYYGLSYGGATAMRLPPFDPRFKAVVCGGNFNEWIRKLTTVDDRYSYMFTFEYEILEWNMADLASHADLGRLIAPRPFLVERGHRDGVGSDEWVLYEYAKVRRFYDEMKIGDRTDIAFFNGPHRVDGPAAIKFLQRHLGPAGK